MILSIYTSEPTNPWLRAAGMGNEQRHKCPDTPELTGYSQSRSWQRGCSLSKGTQVPIACKHWLLLAYES